MYRIIETPYFRKTLSLNFNPSEIRRIFKTLYTLKSHPFYGKALRTPFLREMKLKNKRIYFLVHEELKVILLLMLGTKKSQKDDIEKLYKTISTFRENIEKEFGF